MIWIDTHVAFWLHDADIGKLSRNARQAIEHAPSLRYSPMVRLELVYLQQIGRLGISIDSFFERLHRLVSLTVSSSPFADVCREAEAITWTRDAFDRLIVAEAALHKARLVTADRGIRKHYARAVW